MPKSAHKDTFALENLQDKSFWPDLILDHPLASYPERLNASYELLERTIESVGPNKSAIIAADGDFTYGELLELVNQISNYLISQGVQSGNRVAIRSPNNAMAVAIWLAILRVGAIAVTTIPLQRAVELAKIIEIGQIQFALVDHRFVEEWAAIPNYSGKTLIVGGENGVNKEVERQSKEFEVCDTAADDVSLFAFTSG